MDCVCMPFRGWMGKTKDLSAFERGMVVGAMRTGLSMSRTATLLGFSHSTVSCVYQEWYTAQRTSSQLDTTVGSIGVNIRVECFWHLVESMPQQMEVVLRAKGGAKKDCYLKCVCLRRTDDIQSPYMSSWGSGTVFGAFSITSHWRPRVERYRAMLLIRDVLEGFIFNTATWDRNGSSLQRTYFIRVH